MGRDQGGTRTSLFRRQLPRARHTPSCIRSSQSPQNDIQGSLFSLHGSIPRKTVRYVFLLLGVPALLLRAFLHRARVGLDRSTVSLYCFLAIFVSISVYRPRPLSFCCIQRVYLCCIQKVVSKQCLSLLLPTNKKTQNRRQLHCLVLLSPASFAPMVLRCRNPVKKHAFPIFYKYFSISLGVSGSFHCSFILFLAISPSIGIFLHGSPRRGVSSLSLRFQGVFFASLSLQRRRGCLVSPVVGLPSGVRGTR